MRPERRISGEALGWILLGEWRARPGRVVVAILAIAVGVALGFAVHLVNRSALDEFGRALHAVNGEADLQVHSTTPAGFDEGLYPRLARLPGIAAASPVVEIAARLEPGGEKPLTVLGLDILRAVQVTPSLSPAALGGAATDARVTVFDPEALHMSAEALRDSGRRVGDTVTLSTGGRRASFRIAGLLPGVPEAQRLAVTDIAAAQWRLGSPGRLQRIDLRLASGVDRGRIEAEIRAILPADAQIVTAESQDRQGDSLSRAYRVNLEMLAMVALLTGGFLVYSAQALSVARRRPQFALARVLGLTRRGLIAQLMTEGAVLGLVGAAAGVGLGLGLAALALRALGGDLGGGYFAGSRPHLAFAPGAALVFLGLGLAVALAGGVLPAIEAGRAQPAIALKGAGDGADPRRRPGWRLGATLLAGGIIAAFAPPVLDLPLFGYGAIALMLAGGVAAMPWLARLLLSPLRRIQDPPPSVALAISRLWGAPGQAAIALSGVVASTSLMVAMAVMVVSFRGSVEDWLVQVLPSDLYVRVQAPGAGGLDPVAQDRLAHAPGVGRIGFRKTVPLRLSPDRPPVILSVAPLDPAQPGRTLPMLGASWPVPAGQVPVWISEPMARLYHLRPGASLTLPLPGGGRPVFVAGVWRDYARQFGAVAMSEPDYVRLTGDRLRTEAAVDLAPGASPAATIRALRAALPPDQAAQLDFAQPKDLRTLALRLFDRSFAVTYALEAIAIVVGLMGVAATISAQTLARTREFGMLRHIGVLRRQIVGMLALEGALLGAVGVAAGLGLGVAMSQVLIQVVNPQSFHWTMETRMPVALFTGLAAALVGASAGAAVLAGRSALSAGAVRAVREDW